MHGLKAWRQWAYKSCIAVPHCPTACGQWEVELLLCTATLPRGQEPSEHRPCTPSLPRGSGQWNSFHALPYCLGVVDSATLAIHCRNAWGWWAVQLLQHTASLPGSSGEWNYCYALPLCLGAKAVRNAVMHCLAAEGKRTVELL